MFVALCFLVLVAHLLPLQGLNAPAHSPDADPTRLPAPEVIWAGPDLMLAMILAWTARRPDVVPVVVLAGVLFLADLVLQRPPGLWTALVILLSEAIRSRAVVLRGLPFWIEWALVSVGIVVIVTLNRGILVLLEVPQAGVFLVASQAIFTCLIYPLVAMAAHYIFSVRRPSPGAVDALGHRL